MLTGNRILEPKNQQGVALLEVLIAVVVLAIGLIAIASFQGGMIRSGSDAKNRTIATTIAQDEMEELRNGDVDNDGDIDNNDYTAINNGGPTTVTVPDANTTFSVTRTVTDYYFAGADQPASTTPPTGVTNPIPDYKQIQVTVAWADETGDNQQVAVQGYINANLPSATGSTLTNNNNTQQTPTVAYTPGSAPEIVAIPTSASGDEVQEATTPKPQIYTQSGTRVVSFDEVTYDTANNNAIQNRDSFRTVNCVCDFGTTPATGGGLTPAYLNEEGIWTSGERDGNKIIATAASGKFSYDVNGDGTNDNVNLSKQPELCDMCCRDHHDPSTVGTDTDPYDYYDPFRHHMVTGDHAHYMFGTEVTSNLYLENCRFVRINGLLRVAQDWRLESLQTIPALYLTSGDGIPDIQNYVQEFVERYIAEINTANYPGTTPNLNPVSTSGDLTSAWENLPNLEDEDTIDSPANDQSLSVNSTSQLITRAIYIDFMADDLINELKSNFDISLVPLHEVNVTLLSHWSHEATGAVSVTNSGIASDIELGDRGLVTGENDGTPPAWVRADIKRSNSGLTDSTAIDPDDTMPSSPSFPNIDQLDFIVGSSTTPTAPGEISVSGEITIDTKGNDAAIGLISLGNLSISFTLSAYCSIGVGNASFQCNLTSEVNSFTITITGYTKPGEHNCGTKPKPNFVSAIFDNQAVISFDNSDWTVSKSVSDNETINDTTVFTLSRSASATATSYTDFIIEIKEGSGEVFSCLPL